MFKQQPKGCGTTNNPRIKDQVKSFQALGLIPFYSVLGIGIGLCLAGCARQETPIRPLSEPLVLVTEEERARLHDIAFPLEVQPTRVPAQSGQIFSYSSKQSIIDLFDFYRADMEYLGWDAVAAFKAAAECCIVFEKPAKRCIITIRPGETSHQAHVVIFIAPKK